MPMDCENAWISWFAHFLVDERREQARGELRVLRLLDDERGGGLDGELVQLARGGAVVETADGLRGDAHRVDVGQADAAAPDRAHDLVDVHRLGGAVALADAHGGLAVSARRCGIDRWQAAHAQRRGASKRLESTRSASGCHSPVLSLRPRGSEGGKCGRRAERRECLRDLPALPRGVRRTAAGPRIGEGRRRDAGRSSGLRGASATERVVCLLFAASRPVKASAHGEGRSRLPLRDSPGMPLCEVTGFPFSVAGLTPATPTRGTT